MDTINQYNFNEEVQAIAEGILSDYNLDEVDVYDACHEVCDGHEWVIYYYQAKQLCCNVDTDEGVEWLDDCGAVFKPEDFHVLCTKIAFATLLVAVQAKTQELLEALEDA